MPRFSFGGLVDKFKEKVVEPIKEKVIEPVKVAVIEPIKEKVIEPIVDKFADLKKQLGENFDKAIKELGEVGTKTLDKEIALKIDAGTPGVKKNIYTDILQ